MTAYEQAKTAGSFFYLVLQQTTRSADIPVGCLTRGGVAFRTRGSDGRHWLSALHCTCLPRHFTVARCLHTRSQQASISNVPLSIFLNVATETAFHSYAPHKGNSLQNSLLLVPHRRILTLIRLSPDLEIPPLVTGISGSNIFVSVVYLVI